MFSRIQGESDRFARYYLRVVNLVMWISSPILAFLFVAAEPVIVLLLGRKWGGAAPVFQILAISALAQLLFESTIWLFVSRGQSERLLKLLLVISPIIIGSFALGLPFGIKGVALCGSAVFVGIIPWILKASFRGTDLTLHRLGRAILYPISSCFLCVLLGEIALHVFEPQRLATQFLTVALTFIAGYSMCLFVTSVRREVVALKKLFRELPLRGEAA